MSPARVAAGLLVVAAAAQVLVVVVASTSLQEVSFRWMGLAGVALPVAVGIAGVGTLAAVVLAGSSAVRSGRRRRRAGLVAVSLALWLPVVALSAPTLRGMASAEDPGQGQEFSLVTQNLWYEHPEPDDAARRVLGLDADVLVLVEYTPQHRAALRRAGILDRYPHRWEEPGELGGGLAVFSRLPFGEPERLSTWSGAVRLGLELDEGTVDLYAVHPVAPSDYWGLRRWKGDYTTLTDALAGAGPDTVVAGDFNATGSHQRLRKLMATADLRDAQDVSGGGFAATWPSSGWMPPVMRLDHVLVGDGIGVAGVEVLDHLGSDHRGLEAILRFPRSAGGQARP